MSTTCNYIDTSHSLHLEHVLLGLLQKRSEALFPVCKSDLSRELHSLPFPPLHLRAGKARKTASQLHPKYRWAGNARWYWQSLTGINSLYNIIQFTISLQCHGHFYSATCLNCGEKYSSADLKEDIFNEATPICQKLVTKSNTEDTAESTTDILLGHITDKPKLTDSLSPEKESTDTDGTTKTPDAHTADPADRVADLSTVIPVQRCCGGVIKPDIVFFGESLPKVIAPTPVSPSVNW